jgi:hypothetical protein
MFDPTVDYVKVSADYEENGPYCVDTIDNVMHDIRQHIRESCEPWPYRIQGIPITEDEYNALPEFDGF